MKWMTHPNMSKPTEGARRCVRKFAWLPKHCIGNYTVWLETYDSQQVYKLMTRYSHLGRFPIKHLVWVEEEAHYLEVYL